MESTCAYCQASFTSQRITKKYCSDNCKQMAYFIRNGLVLAGVNNNLPIVLEKIKTDSVKCSNENPVTVKYDKPILQQEPIVIPHYTAAQEITPKPLCKPVSFGAVINVIKKESSNNCTSCQNPIAKCNTTTINNPSPNENSSKPIEIKTTHETHQPVNSIEFANTEEESETEPEEETTHNQVIKKERVNNILLEAKKIIEQDDEEYNIPYKWVESKLIRYIDQKYMNDDTAMSLLEPLRHWGYEKAQLINWINIRLRCLIESLIRLSNYSRIDTHTILCVSDAFNRLQKSNAYKNLPDNYPYKELIAELGIKVNEIAEQNRNEAQLVFCLPLMRKAQLLTIRYRMLTNVPAIKFSELDFIEEGNPIKIINSDDDDDENDDNDETERRRPRDTWQRKLRAIKREREQNKAADKNNPLENITHEKANQKSFAQYFMQEYDKK